jgi:hypothetical protein
MLGRKTRMLLRHYLEQGRKKSCAGARGASAEHHPSLDRNGDLLVA